MEIAAVLAYTLMPVHSVGGGIMLGIDLDLSMPVSYGAAVLGSLIPVPFLLVVLKTVYDRIFSAERRKTGRVLGKEWIVLIVAAIPFLPGAVWIGSAAGVILCISIKKACAVICLGSIISGMTALALYAAGIVS